MYRNLVVFLCVFCVFAFAAPTFAQGVNNRVSNLTVTCANGATFSNGVEVIVIGMRAGYSYTATAVGLDGFDPVLAVLDTSGNGLCSDDDSNASRYAANLPSTGRVRASDTSAQVIFTQSSGEDFADVSLVVGGFGNATGEFLLFLEGMSVTANDGAGDGFSVNITPAMIASGVPVTTYMITAADSKLDPFIYQAEGGASSDILTDNDGDEITCDDAGDANSCYDTETKLNNSNVQLGSVELPGWEYDAMLTSNLREVRLNQDRTNNYFTYYMSSYQNETKGAYLLVFHVGIG